MSCCLLTTEKAIQPLGIQGAVRRPPEWSLPLRRDLDLPANRWAFAPTQLQPSWECNAIPDDALCILLLSSCFHWKLVRTYRNNSHAHSQTAMRLTRGARKIYKIQFRQNCFEEKGTLETTLDMKFHPARRFPIILSLHTKALTSVFSAEREARPWLYTELHTHLALCMGSFCWGRKSTFPF